MQLGEISYVAIDNEYTVVLFPFYKLPLKRLKRGAIVVFQVKDSGSWFFVGGMQHRVHRFKAHFGGSF